MKPRIICKSLGALIVLALMALFGGCASRDIPLSASPPLYSQDKIQAADHWDNIADSVALRIQKTLEDRPDLVNRPVYVQPPNSRPFSRALYSLLTTRLVSKGMQVSGQPEPESLLLEYDLQLIRYERERRTWTPGLASLGLALASVAGVGYGTASEHELVLNFHLIHNNRYVMHLSQIFYINDQDRDLYANVPLADGKADQLRRVPLVSR
ncbi:MAG: hypothetical protein LBP61_04390 [Desulfovibrio sp.]|jgi:hypothetical protein|nr:hypothetical protein [Desulfovibrio sp.]